VYEYLVNIALFPVNIGYRAIVLTITPDHYSAAKVYRHIQYRGILFATQFYLEAVGELSLQPTELFDLSLFSMTYPVSNDRAFAVEHSVWRKLGVVLDDVGVFIPLNMEKGIPGWFVPMNHGRIQQNKGQQPNEYSAQSQFHNILPGSNV
jgi:hypothetical protein